MTTLIKRILFILILLIIVYGIYWLVDKKGADELKDNIISNTQETVETFKSNNEKPTIFESPIFEEESLGDLAEIEKIITEKKIIVNDPEIKTPIIENKETIKVKTVKIEAKPKPKAKTTPKPSKSILFELFN